MTLTAPRLHSDPAYRIQELAGLSEMQPADWNRLVQTDNPFLTHEFLEGLEACDCLAPHGWIPRHLIASRDGAAVGVLPLYQKTNSYGEFVFDWAWADAYERAGGRYFPKLVTAIPFTPVRGPRLLVNPDHPHPEAVKARLLQAVIEMADAEGISSYHLLLPDNPDAELYARHEFLPRKTIQFYWHNRGYRDFEDFLDALTSKKRKQIKRERRRIAEAGLEIEVLPGDRISDRHWAVFHAFYCSTFHRRWGSPRLTRGFFQLLSRRLPRQTLLILARHNGGYVAGAFAMRDQGTLYGRHWGCGRQYDFLHFELCYYQTIDYCIRNGLARLDAGVQGEHKLSRGFEPVVTWSRHWIRHPGFRKAIGDFLERESADIDAYIGELQRHLPYKVERRPQTPELVDDP